MSPLRLIILAILLYIGYRLIVGGKKKKKIAAKKSRSEQKEMPLSDTLEEDPVCSKLVPRQQAITYSNDGKTYYFCSEKCCNEFRSKKGEKQ